MKVIFLDFDGVLNSAASFVYETRLRKKHPQTTKKLPPVNQTLCKICTSNFIEILDAAPDAKIVISSSWRELFTLDWLKKKLEEYGIDGTRVIDRTPSSFSGDRGREIESWMDDHPEVEKYVILDDNWIGPPYQDNDLSSTNFVKTTWPVGLTLDKTFEAIKILGGKSRLRQDDE